VIRALLSFVIIATVAYLAATSQSPSLKFRQDGLPNPQPPAQGRQQAAPPTDENVAIQRELRDATNRLADDTHNLAYYTLGLIVVGLLAVVAQSWLLYKQNVYTGVSAKAAQASAEAAKISAETARDEFAISRRPRLIVRHVVLPLEYETVLEGHFDVANIGELPAQIVNAHCEVFMGKTLPMRRPYDDNLIGNIKADFLTIHPGTEQRFIIPDRVTLDGAEYKDVHNAIEIGHRIKENVYILGYVRYIDKQQRFRRTVFARVFDYQLKRFTPIEDSDYEYAD
jgi:hypothetical protein